MPERPRGLSGLHRRQFLGAACAAVALRRPAAAAPAISIGLQLSSVAESLQKDFSGTLRRVAELGYRDVELSAPLRQKRAADIKQALLDAGLRCVSAHWDMWDDSTETQNTIDAASELGLEYVVTGFPAQMTATGLKPTDGTPADIRMLTEKMTWNDWRWNIDWFNHVGGYAQKANLQFVYHNHEMEFRQFNGVTLLDDLMARTEYTRVKLQLDCTWAAKAGQDVVGLIQRHADRIVMLHVPADKAADFRPAVAAAEKIGVRTVFVEEVSPLEKLAQARAALIA